jgi:hypothetical protein
MFTRNHSRVSTVSRQFLLAIVILCPLISQAGESIQTVLLDSFEFESEVEAVKAMKELRLFDTGCPLAHTRRSWPPNGTVLYPGRTDCARYRPAVLSDHSEG